MLGFISRRRAKAERAVELDEGIQERVQQLEKLDRTVQLEEELAALKRELSDERIAAEEAKAERERKDRDTEHKVALALKQADHDKETGVKEAKLAVREENLQAEKDRMEARVEEIKDAVKSESESQRALLNTVIGALPKRTISETLTVGRRELEAGDGDGDGTDIVDAD